MISWVVVELADKDLEHSDIRRYNSHSEVSVSVSRSPASNASEVPVLNDGQLGNGSMEQGTSKGMIPQELVGRLWSLFTWFR